MSGRDNIALTLTERLALAAKQSKEKREQPYYRWPLLAQAELDSDQINRDKDTTDD